MDRPVYHLPFGPNWFQPQILSFSPSFQKLAIGINDSVHVMDYQNKSPLYDLVPSNQKLRVTALFMLDEQQTYVAYSKFIACYQEDQQIWITEIQLSNVLYILKYDGIYLLDQNGTILQFSNKNILRQSDQKIKNYFQSENTLVLENKIEVWEDNFSKKINEIQIDGKILDCDLQDKKLVTLLKQKNKIEVHIFNNLQIIQKFCVSFKGSLLEKPSICIRLYLDSILITGIKGEIFKLKNNQEKDLILDSDKVNTYYNGSGDFNIDNEEYQVFIFFSYYQKKTFVDNPHYKPIYHIVKMNNNLIFLSQDRIVSFWDSEKLIYTLNLLSCKYLQLHSYKNSLICLGQDNSIRKWTFKQQDKYYNVTIWKQLNNLRVNNIVIDQNQEGIIAIATDFQLGIYDLNAQKLVKLTENLKSRILNVYWIEEKFQLTQDIKIVQQDKSYIKQLNQKQQILAICENQVFYWNQTKCHNMSLNLPFDFYLNSVDYLKDLNLLALGSKSGKVTFSVLDQKYQDCSIVESVQPISALKFLFKENEILLAVGSFDRSIYILQIFIANSQVSSQKLFHFKHKSPITKLSWNQNYDILAVGYHQSTVQIWNVDPEKEEQVELANIRGHRGYVMDSVFLSQQQNLIASCSDDQSIKVWDYTKVKNMKPPNKKKKKKVKLD